MIRRPAAAAAALLCLALLSTGTAHAAEAPASTSAVGAATYLASQQAANGSITAEFGNLYANTARLAIALGATGTQKGAFDRAVAYLLANGATGPQTAGVDDPAALALGILAVRDAGLDPHAFGGSDLVARLVATQQTSGLFGAANSDFDGGIRQGLGLLALDGDATAHAAAIKAGDYVLTQEECATGGFGSPKATCTQDFHVDTNGTARAIEGLATLLDDPTVDAQTVTSAISRGLNYLGSFTTASGVAFGPDSPADPDSTSLAISAYLAAGRTVPATLTPALQAFQLDDPAGALFYPPFGDEAPAAQVYATLEGTVGLALHSTGQAPRAFPAGATPTASASATPSVSAIPVTSVTVTVAAAAATTAAPALPFTGSSDTSLLAGLGALLVVGGAVSAGAGVAVHRRRM